MILMQSWAALSAAALGVSLLHALVDWHIGLFGATLEVLSTPQTMGVTRGSTGVATGFQEHSP